jgi:hypothetical protein
MSSKLYCGNIVKAVSAGCRLFWRRHLTATTNLASARPYLKEPMLFYVHHLIFLPGRRLVILCEKFQDFLRPAGSLYPGRLDDAELFARNTIVDSNFPNVISAATHGILKYRILQICMWLLK